MSITEELNCTNVARKALFGEIHEVVLGPLNTPCQSLDLISENHEASQFFKSSVEVKERVVNAIQHHVLLIHECKVKQDGVRRGFHWREEIKFKKKL